MKCKHNKILILTIIVVSAFSLLITSGCMGNGQEYKYSETIGGIPVYSDIPLSEVENWNGMILGHKNDTSARGCVLEISSVLSSSREGPEVNVEKSDVTRIYIRENSANIKGSNDDDIRNACHIFVCIKEGIKCPGNLNKIKDVMGSDRLITVVGEDVQGAGVRGYAEIMIALGYLQAENLDRGKASFIVPYLKQGGVCKLQPFRNQYQIINETLANETVNNCDVKGIFIEKSDKNEIIIEDDRILLLGDDKHLYSESIIVSDVIAPELRLKMHQQN